MTTKIRMTLGVLLLLLLIVGGCSILYRKAGELVTRKAMERLSGGEITVDPDEGTTTLKTSKGTLTTGGSHPPEHWPDDIPVYAGSTIQFSGSDDGSEGGVGMALLLTSDDDPSTITAFYTTRLKASGWTLGNTMKAGGSTVLLMTKDTKAVSITVTSAEGTTSIAIGVQNR